MAIEKVIIAGAGGQGIMLLGKIMAEAAMRENKYITWLPAYGPEVRGGTAYCMVVISDTEIGSPYITQADTLIVMNAPSMAKFAGRIKKNGLLIVNSSLVTGLKCAAKQKCLQYPFTDAAIKLGNIRIANMVALGCYLAEKKNIETETVIKVIADIAPPDKRNLIAVNKEAVYYGEGLLK